MGKPVSVGFGQKLNLKVVFNLKFKSLLEKTALDQDRLESKQAQKNEFMGKYQVKINTCTNLISPNFACYDVICYNVISQLTYSRKSTPSLTLYAFVGCSQICSVSTCCFWLCWFYISTASSLVLIHNRTLLLLLCSELQLGCFIMSWILKKKKFAENFGHLYS